jgi:hypothetical protein
MRHIRAEKDMIWIYIFCSADTFRRFLLPSKKERHRKERCSTRPTSVSNAITRLPEHFQLSRRPLQHACSLPTDTQAKSSAKQGFHTVLIEMARPGGPVREWQSGKGMLALHSNQSV